METPNNALERLAVYGGQPVRRKKMPPRLAFGEAEIARLLEAIKYYQDRGEDPPYQGHFEEEFCQCFVRFMGGGFADAVATGTAAVYVALAALDVPQRSHVVISPVTDSGPLNCIISQGMVPVVADSKPDSYNMGVAEFLARVTPETSAVIAVHCAGEPLEIDEIVSEAHAKGIRVLEDCSQAPGALCKGKRVGTFGDIAAFSTMYRKTLAAGASSGMVYTDSEELYKRALAHADRGKQIWRDDLDLRDPGCALFPALNWNTDELSCAIGISSLERLQDTIDKRVFFVTQMIALINAESHACKPYAFHEGVSPFFFPVFVDENELTCSKTTFAKALAAEGVGLGADYGCVISSWDWAKPYLYDDFETANALSTRDRSFNLYVNERYGEEEANDIITAILKIEAAFSK